MENHFITGNSSIGIFSDEGGQVFGGYGMKSENLLKTSSGLSKFWDSTPVSKSRAGSNSVFLAGRRVALHLMVQPNIGRDVLKNEALKDQGFLSRILIAWPDSNIGQRIIDVTPESELKKKKAIGVLEQYSERVVELLGKEYPTHPDDPQELIPDVLPLSEDAKQLLVKFYNRVEVSQQKGSAFYDMRGFASKMPEQAARIAAVLTLFAKEDAEEINASYMKNAIELADWYLNEAHRINSAGNACPKLLAADKLRIWLDRHAGMKNITVRMISKAGPSGMRNAELALEAINTLVKFGWLIANKEPTVIGNHLSTMTWEVVRLEQ